MTKWEQLRQPVDDTEVEWRVQQCGESGVKKWALLVPYVDSRAIMNRFDSVVGAENWQDKYVPISLNGQQGFICELSVREDSENEYITKSDAAPLTDIEGIKGGVSGALKRAAVKFGIGRDLYDLNEVWGQDIRDGHPPKGKSNTVAIIDKKKKIRAWCYAPKLDDLRGDAPPAPLPAPEATQIADRCIKGIDKLIMEDAITAQDRDDAIATWLDTKTIQECTDNTKLTKFLKEYIGPTYKEWEKKEKTE